jgi:transposase-like protein
MNQSKPFKWRHYQPEIILLSVRWYLRYSLSYRDLEEIMMERGLEIDHSTLNRWVLKYSPELDKRIRRYLKPAKGSYRFDETYIKIKGKWMFLYRAVDPHGQTIDFMLSAKRDRHAAKRFFRKMMQSDHAAPPYAMTVDKNPAYPIAFKAAQDDDLIPKGCKLRQSKYLNNIVEQDHRFIKRLVNPGMGFGSFWTAENTLAGFEAMNTIRKGQVRGVPKGDILGQARFVSSVFGLA